MYLFCDISICFEDCDPVSTIFHRPVRPGQPADNFVINIIKGCDRRKRKKRSLLTDTYGDSYEDQIISLGPIELSGPEDGSEWDLSLDDSRMDLRTVALVCGIIATTFLIGLAGKSY